MIMTVFTHAYIATFVHTITPSKLFLQVLALNPDNQQEFLRLIRNHFKDF